MRSPRAALALVVAGLVAAAGVAAPITSGALDGVQAWSNDDTPRAASVGAVGASTALAVAVTTDGALWQRAPAEPWSSAPGAPLLRKARVAFDASDPDVAYVAGVGGVARTTDGGASWALVLEVARAARIDVAEDGTVAVGARHDDATNHVHVSTDRGSTWDVTNGPLPPVDPICGVVFGRSSAELLVMTNDRSWYSHDGGTSWSETPGAGLDMVAEADGTAWRAEGLLLERSDDGGATWTAVSTPAFATLLAPHPVGGLYLATTAGFQLTRDAGASWTSLGFDGAVFGANALAAHAGDPDALLVGHDDVGVARIAPVALGDHAFVGDADGFPPTPLTAVRVAPDGSLAVAAGATGIYARRGVDGPWAHTGAGLALVAPTEVAVGGAGRTAFVGGQGLFGAPVVEASRDGAVHFERVTLDAGRAGEVTGIAVDPDDDLHALASVATSDGRGLAFVTHDGGASWSEVLAVAGALTGAAWDPAGPLVASAVGLLAPGPLTTWVPAGGPPVARAVDAHGGVVAAAGAAGTLWHAAADDPTPLPWAGPGVSVTALAVAGDEAAWARTRLGGLVACTGPAPATCVPGGPPVAAAGVAYDARADQVLAPTAEGLYRAAFGASQAD